MALPETTGGVPDADILGHMIAQDFTPGGTPIYFPTYAMRRTALAEIEAMLPQIIIGIQKVHETRPKRSPCGTKTEQ